MVKQLIIGDAAQELAHTRRVLERLPEEHMSWKPHEKSMTLGGLATHLINLLNWQIAIFQYPEFDLSTVPLRREALEKCADVLEEFDANAAKLSSCSPNATRKRSATNGRCATATISSSARRGRLRSAPSASATWSIIGLSSGYICGFDIPVPGIYGPSADEAAQ